MQFHTYSVKDIIDKLGDMSKKIVDKWRDKCWDWGLSIIKCGTLDTVAGGETTDWTVLLLLDPGQ